MNRFLAAVLLTLTVALAGCSGGDGDSSSSSSSEDPCAKDGLVTVVDPMTGEESCGTANPAYTITVDPFEDTSIYELFTVTWRLGTDENLSHAMRTEVRASPVSVPDSELAGFDDYGFSLGKHEHQNFEDGKTYTGSYVFEEPGTYYIRGLAAFAGADDQWTDEMMLVVGELQPTGTNHPLNVALIGPLGGLDNTDLTIIIGDTVTWTNENPLLPITITSTTAVASFEVTADAGGTSAPLLLTVPGTYNYQATEGLFTYGGLINVALPSTE